MNLYVVRAEYGKYTQNFLNGGYVAIGWLPNDKLGHVTNREELAELYKKEYPQDTSPVVIGQQVGQIARFMHEIHVGDYVITPSDNTEYIYYGIVSSSYYPAKGDDGCPYTQRRSVKWEPTPILRSQFSVPFQNTIRSSLTVFKVNHLRNFLETIGRADLVPKDELRQESNYYEAVINKVLELDATEFELLVTDILAGMGFEGAKHVGKVADGGVDVTGELNVSNFAKVKVFVQAKRYKLGQRINAGTVKALRQSIPFGGQGAFITTCDYQNNAKEVALEPGFPRIGLINGNQLVDLLSEHWDSITPDLKDKLGLKVGLVTI